MKQHYDYILNEALLHYSKSEEINKNKFETEKNDKINKLKNDKISIFKWFNNVVQSKVKSVFGTKLTMWIVFIVQSCLTYYPFVYMIKFIFNSDVSGLGTYLVYFLINYLVVKFIGNKVLIVDHCRINEEKRRKFEDGVSHVRFSDFTKDNKVNERVLNYLKNRTPKRFINDLISDGIISYNEGKCLSDNLTYEKLLNYMITY